MRVSTDILLRVEILRYRFGKDENFIPVISEPPRPETMDFSVVIEQELTHDCMYYLRTVQEPLRRPAMAWSSPVWILTG